MHLQFFHSRTQKFGKENCPYLKPQFDAQLGNLKLRGMIQKKFWASHVQLKFLKGKMDKGSIFLPEKHWADHQQRNPNICLEIFSQLDMSYWKVHTLRVSIQKQAWLVHECAFCCQWVTCRICPSVTVLGKGENAVYPGQNYCNDMIWANNSKCCAWSSG